MAWSLSNNKRFLIKIFFSLIGKISLTGLNLLIKTGIKTKNEKIPATPQSEKEEGKIEMKMALGKNKSVPIELFQIMARNKKGIKAKPRIFGERAKNAPIIVPIPRPPANLIKILQLWPITAARPEKTCIPGEKPSRCAPKTARYPFRTSRSPVRTPASFPIFLKTLEPEVFLQPISKIFLPVENVVIK